MKLVPLDVARVIHLPRRKIYLISLSIAEKTRPIGQIVRELNDVAAEIITIYGYCIDGAGHLSVVVDLTNAKLDIDELVNRLSRMSEITRVSYVAPEEPGLLIDKYHFPITYGAGRAVLFDIETLSSMFDEIKRQWGSAGEAFIYYLGYIGGKSFAKHFSEKYRELNERKIYIIMRDTIQAYGYGLVDKVEKTDNEVIIRVRDLFECKPVEGKRTSPNSHFFRGYVSGIASVMLNRDMLAEEVKCIAMGDPYCEFIVRERAWRRRAE